MSLIANIFSETPSARNQQTCNANILTGFYMTWFPTKGTSTQALESSKDIKFSCVFRVGQYCLINKASDIFLFTLLLFKPFYGAVAWWLRCWIPNPRVPCSKPLGGSKVDSAFHPYEVNKMSTRNFWELNGKK